MEAALAESPARNQQAERSVAITEQRFNLAEYWRRDFVVNAEIGTTKEDILRPEYWALVAQHLKPFDHIEVRDEAGEWIAELSVRQADRTWANVALLHFHQFVAISDQPGVAARHRVEWKGPQHKWAVIRNGDSQMVQKGFSERESANEWLRNHERTVTAT